jgi:DtxR family Mn-dependent transcriptional regulator
MLKRLKNDGLVKHVPYQGVELTELGRREALRELRRHRILEVFLVEIMGFTWDEVHEHADQLGQGLNDALTGRMAEMTREPQRCPHGEPIPNAQGDLPIVEDISMINLGVGTSGVISRVRTHDPERLRYFHSLELVPGRTFTIVGRAPFNGPMRLRVGRDEVVLGVELTKQIWVTPD